MYYNHASLCSLREEKEKAKTVYIPLHSMNYRYLNQNAGNNIFEYNCQNNFGLWRLRCWKSGHEQLKLECGRY